MLGLVPKPLVFQKLERRNSDSRSIIGWRDSCLFSFLFVGNSDEEFQRSKICQTFQGGEKKKMK